MRKDVRRKLLIEEIDQAIVQSHHLQVSPEEFLKVVRERITAFEQRRRASKNIQED